MAEDEGTGRQFLGHELEELEESGTWAAPGLELYNGTRMISAAERRCIKMNVRARRPQIWHAILHAQSDLGGHENDLIAVSH